MELSTAVALPYPAAIAVVFEMNSACVCVKCVVFFASHTLLSGGHNGMFHIFP